MMSMALERISESAISSACSPLSGCEISESVFRVDESGDTAGLLGFGDGVDRQGRLARGFGTVNLDDASFGVTAYAERHVQGDRTRGDYLYVGDLCARHAHDRAFAEILLDLLHHRVKYL